MIAALALVASLGAHWVNWSAPGLVVTQAGIAVGTPRKDERLILFFKYGDCRQMRVYAGHYGDLDAARRFLWRSKFCTKKH